MKCANKIQRQNPDSPIALIISPTRELCFQLFEEARAFATRMFFCILKQISFLFIFIVVKGHG